MWNVQQKDARRASDVLTRAVLQYAAAARFDAIALNEVWHDREALLALSEPLGYPHASLHRGRLGSRLGLLSASPLRVMPVRHLVGHGAICAAPAAAAAAASSGGNGAVGISGSKGDRSPTATATGDGDGDGDGGNPDDPPWVCVAHLGQTEATRLAELPSLLGALPTRQPALLVGDLNALSPLDFSPPTAAAVLDAAGGAAAAAAGVGAGSGGRVHAKANASSLPLAGHVLSQHVLSQLRSSRKLTKKYLNASAMPAVRVMGALLKAGLLDLAPLGGWAHATWRPAAARTALSAEEEARLRVAPSPPPPPPAMTATATTVAAAGAAADAIIAPTGPELRIDYALANAALAASCAPPTGVRGGGGGGGGGAAPGWGAWASVVPAKELAAHGVGSLSEHAPLRVVVGAGLADGVGRDAYLRAAAAQQAAAEAAAASPSPRSVPSARGGAGGLGAPPGGSSARGAFAVQEADPAYRLGGAGHGLSESEVASMPGGAPSRARAAAGSGNGNGGGSGSGGGACDALGTGRARNLAHLRSEVETGETFAKRCQALSGVLRMLGLRRRLKTCAVVGGSGILRQHPRGREIDAHEAVLRVNNCPVGGFEHLVGSRTSVRFLNGPRSIIWGRQIAQQKGRRPVPPPELTRNDHVVVWGDLGTLDRLKSALPRNASVVRANTRFRRECADKTFWSAEELDAHRASNGVPRLEITFGFEAVAHALYACEEVNIYGFFLGHDDAKRQTNAAASGSGKAMEVPYHYYENQTYDKSAKDPWRPWTYRFHNFELEHQKFRQLDAACWLNVVT